MNTQSVAWRGIRVEKGDRVCRSSAPALIYFSAEYGHAEQYAISGDPQVLGYIQALNLDGLRIKPASRILKGRRHGAAYVGTPDACEWAESLLANSGLDGVSYLEAGVRCYLLRTECVYGRIRTRTRDQWERIYRW